MSRTVEASTEVLPRIGKEAIAELAEKGVVVCRDFISKDLVASLRHDVDNLRSKNRFKIAKIGQDYTNALNEDIRVAETAFIGTSKLQDCPDASRSSLYDILEMLRSDLSGNQMLDVIEKDTGNMLKSSPALDPNLSETLYGYYPEGGFYRRHCDAVENSASTLRCYSLLLYINENWKPGDGGELRVHRDSGRDFLPEGESPNFIDVEPYGGTLVLFKSELVPHEVLNTEATRAAVIGWFNRAVTMSDINALSSESDKTRTILLFAAGLLIMTGLGIILMN